MNVNPFCTRCMEDFETSNHTFFTCPHTVAIWRNSRIPHNNLVDPSIGLEAKISYLLHLGNDIRVEKHIRTLPFWILWHIWKGQNDLLFNRKVRSHEDTINKAKLDTKEWLDETEKLPLNITHEIHPSESRLQRWTKPMKDWVKCNYDVSHHLGNQASGMGWIIRDDYGKFMHCGMGKFQGRMTIEEAKCSSLIWSLQAAWGLGYKKIEFEGDNQIINQVINGKIQNWRLQVYIETINLWKTMFEEIKFVYNLVCIHRR